MSAVGKRRPSREYREWTLDQWCDLVRSLGVNTLTQWATVSRGTYNRATMLGIQRDVARALGWLPRLDTGEMYQLTDHEFAERFRARGVASLTQMWRSAQHWCEFLRREGRLERVASLLGISYSQESHSNDVEYYLERCRRIGDFSAWCLLDKNAAETARRHGLMRKIRARAPKRPDNGYPTAGGRCQSLPELALARTLEANDVPFVTQLPYPFTFPRGRRHKSKCDFYLTEHGAFVEVWGVDPDDQGEQWRDYQLRRRFKTDLCRALNLQLLHIEGWLLFRKGIEIYRSHLGAVLEEAGISLPVVLSDAETLAAEPVGNGEGRR